MTKNIIVHEFGQIMAVILSSNLPLSQDILFMPDSEENERPSGTKDLYLISGEKEFNL